MTRRESGQGSESAGGATAPTQAERLPSQRHLFSIPREVAYLNCAYMSPLMQSAEEAGISGLRRKLSPWEISPADFFAESERARLLFAALIGATADGIAIVPAVSYGMAVATANLPLGPGQTVVLPAEEFPSAVLAWREAAARAGARIVTVARPDDGDWTSAILQAIDDRTAVVCASQTHWICGGRIDLERIAARCREAGAALVLDLTQSAGALPFDVSAVKPDFAVAACYKWLMGPYSVGFLYVAPQWRAGVPLEQGWVVRQGAEDFRNLIDYKDIYEPGARRFDVGERSNFALMPAACAAIEQLIAWSPERIAATLGDITERIVEATAPLGASALPRSRRSAHYLGLRFAGGLPEDLPARLARHGVYVSVRGERLRVTPHLYNDGEDVARLIEALGKALAP